MLSMVHEGRAAVAFGVRREQFRVTRLCPSVAANVQVVAGFGGDQPDVFALSLGTLADAATDRQLDFVRSANAAIPFRDQVIIGIRFADSVSPRLASPFMKQLGAGFCQPVGQCFYHDGTVIVVVLLEPFDEAFETGAASIDRRQQLQGRLPLALLLPEAGQADGG